MQHVEGEAEWAIQIFSTNKNPCIEEIEVYVWTEVSD